MTAEQKAAVIRLVIVFVLGLVAVFGIDVSGLQDLGLGV